MDEIARNPEDYEGGDDPPNIPSPKEEHPHQPSNANKKTKYSNNKFGRFWQRHWQQWKDVPVHDKSNAIFTIVIAVATTVYAFVTIRQLNEMRSSGAQATEQTRKLIEQATIQANNTHDLALAAQQQANASRTAADAAKSAATTAEKTLKLDQRARLNVTITDKFTIQDGMPISAPIRIANTGKTVARKIEGNVAVSLVERGKNPEFIYAKGSGHPNRRIGAGAIFPNAPIDTHAVAMKTGVKTPTDILLTPEMHKQFREGKWTIIIHGRVWYTDIFGDRHWTKFCFDAGESEVGGNERCINYNGTDDQ